MTGGSRNGYDTAVRRIPAILLLGLFSFLLIEPAVLAENDSRLPACCRRDGLHHCSRTNAQGPFVQGVCPAFPKTGAAPAYSKTIIVRAVRAAFVGLITFPAGRAQTALLCRASYSRARQKRAPPIPAA